MTPKEKAEELVNKYMDITPIDYNINDSIHIINKKALNDMYICKQCALLCVDEVLLSLKQPPSELSFEPHKTYLATLDYWDKVKQKIEKL